MAQVITLTIYSLLRQEVTFYLELFRHKTVSSHRIRFEGE